MGSIQGCQSEGCGQHYEPWIATNRIVSDQTSDLELMFCITECNYIVRDNHTTAEDGINSCIAKPPGERLIETS